MKNGKEHLKFALKLSVGAVLIYYVLRSRMVDFESLKTVLFNPVNLVVSLIFLSFSAFLCATRWYLLARTQGLTLSFVDLIELTMIGNFFNTFMPGSVGGDLIKAWYIAGQEPQRKTKAVFTVLLDRVIGLAVILLYAAVTLLFYRQWLKGHHELQGVAYFLWGFMGASVVSAAVFFSPLLWNASLTTRLLNYLKRNHRLSILIEAALLYRRFPSTVAWAVLLSAGSIMGTNFLYSLLGGTLGLQLDLAHYFFIVPIGITVSAVPLLPGGIGVGQVAFYKIFQWTGAPNPELGATLCTLMQIYTILFNCVGAIFYIKFKRRPADATVTTERVPLATNKRASHLL